MNLDDIARRGAVLAVAAHPDDESFGLGALLAGIAASGAVVRVLCLTHGEASTLGAGDDLATLRRRELEEAAARLGVAGVELRDFPDGALAEIPVPTIDAVVERAVVSSRAATLVAFEPGGVTGHPDHRAATAAAHRAADRHGLPVLEWGVAPHVAAALNEELGTAFVALAGDDVDDVCVDRTEQLAAIACHATQVAGNPVLSRRLVLEGDLERVRLRSPVPIPATMA